MEQKNHLIITLILFSLLILSFIIPVKSPTGLSIFNSLEPIGEFQVQKYSTILESDYKRYTTTNKRLEKIEACKVQDKGFYEAVICNDVGITKDNKVCHSSYLTIDKNSKDKCLDLTKKGYDIIKTDEGGPIVIHENGITSLNSNPTVKKTIAGPRQFLKKYIYLYFGENYGDWNGCYFVEDYYQNKISSYFGIYTGIGKKTEYQTNLPQNALIFEECDKDKDYSKYLKDDSSFIDKSIDYDSIIGNYKYNPSFQIESDYDISIFTKIKDTLDFLSKECLDSINKYSCITNFLRSDQNIANLRYGPINDTKKELYHFSQNLKLCKKQLENNGCYCEISLLDKNLFSRLIKDLEIKSENENLDIKYKDIQFSILNDGFYNTRFIKKIEDIKKGIFPLDEFLEEDTLYIFKSNDIATLLSIEDKDNLKELKVKSCSIDYQYYVFSTISDNKIFYYDKIEEKYRLDKPKIEFAFFLKDIIPPKKIDFDADNLLISKDSFIINFKTSDEIDIDSYFLFASYFDLLLSQYQIDQILKNNVDDNFESIKPITLKDPIICKDYNTLQPVCDLDKDSLLCNIRYDISCNDVYKLKPNILYYFDKKDKYVYIIEIPKILKDQKNLSVSILAKDTSNNIIKEFKDANIKKLVPKDSIIPSVSDIDSDIRYEDDNIIIEIDKESVKNIDNTKTQDLKEYWIFYYNQENIKDSEFAKGILPKADMPYIVQKPDKDIIHPYPNINNGFCYYIIPVDRSIKEFQDDNVPYKDYFNHPYYKALLQSKLIPYKCYTPPKNT